jgi:hypothetical protein
LIIFNGEISYCGVLMGILAIKKILAGTPEIIPRNWGIMGQNGQIRNH